MPPNLTHIISKNCRHFGIWHTLIRFVIIKSRLFFLNHSVNPFIDDEDSILFCTTNPKIIIFYLFIKTNNFNWFLQMFLVFKVQHVNWDSWWPADVLGDPYLCHHIWSLAKIELNCKGKEKWDCEVQTEALWSTTLQWKILLRYFRVLWRRRIPFRLPIRRQRVLRLRNGTYVAVCHYVCWTV